QRVDGVAQLVDLDAGAQVGGGGGEDVAAGERGPGGGQVVVDVGEIDGPLGAAGHGHGRGHEPVVGAHEDGLAVPCLDGHGPAVTAHAGVDHGEHDTDGQVLGGPGQGQRPGPHVVRREPVAAVDDGGAGRDAPDHGLAH